MVTVLLKVGDAEYDLVSGSVAFPEPSQLSAGKFFALARSQPPFEDFLKGDWSNGWNVHFMGLSEEQAVSLGITRVPVKGEDTLAIVASRHSGGAAVATIYVIIEPKTSAGGESPQPLPALFPRSFFWSSSCFPFACRFC
jgi:hypothetical protein